MKKVVSLLLIISMLFAVGCSMFTIQAAGPSVGDEINAFHKAVSVSPRVLTLKRGQAYKLSVTLDPNVVVGDTVYWYSSNDSVASVTSYGLVIAKSSGTATITVYSDSPMVQGYTYVDTCSITVTSDKIVDDGTYFIQTAQTDTSGHYLDKFIKIEGQSSSNDAEMEIGALSGVDDRKWDIALATDGYYRIQSVYSSKYMRVTGSSSAAGATITQNSSIVSGSKWSFMITSSGNYALVPASSTSSLIVLNLPNNTDDYDLNTAIYTSNTDYKDEWTLQRMLPLNGYELPYEPSLWINTDVCFFCNCFQYMLNCQAKPWSPTELWLYVQPGDYSHTSITGFGQDNSLIQQAVEEDVNDYNNDFNTLLIFEEIDEDEKYTQCPSGTYRVALVIGPNNSNQYDYHWYRQDDDGLWSHKLGNLPTSRVDSNGKLIIDPQNASRNYLNLGLSNYTTFVGFFAITPWNHMLYSSNRSFDFDALSNREKAIISLTSIGAKPLGGRAVFSLDFGESCLLTFDCDTMSGTIVCAESIIKIDTNFVLELFLNTIT